MTLAFEEDTGARLAGDGLGPGCAHWRARGDGSTSGPGQPRDGSAPGSRRTVLVDGYLSEDGELWDATGALVAQPRQLAMLLPVDNQQ